MTDLKPYAEPINEAQLEVGEIYFMLNFLDEYMLVPDLKTLVFLGQDVEGKKDGMLYFQDIHSYVRSGAYPKNPLAQGDIYHCSAEQLSCIFSLEKATDELRRCAERRMKKRPGSYEFL